MSVADKAGLTAKARAATSSPILRHMVTHSDAPGIPSSVVTTATWQTVGTLVGFGLSIPVFFATRYGWALWFAGPLVVQQVYRARHRARPKPAGA